MTARTVLVCPGRGSYTADSLGSLPRDHTLVQAAEALRHERGLESLVELDGAAKFEPARHLQPANVAALIYVVSMLDAEAATEYGRPVCVIGNSMGWYTALAVGGALSFEDGFRLVQDMALLQQVDVNGGQVIYPVVDADWKPDADKRRVVDAALSAAPQELFRSIHLGGYEVLAGTRAGLARLTELLPAVKFGRVTYPFRLAQHGPYHTPLVRTVSEQAKAQLADLAFRRPSLTLIDGRGVRHTPWSTDLAALREYTLGAQVTEPYDFTRSLLVALREHAPERLVLPGPGNTLGGICGQILIQARWNGIDSRAAFDAHEQGATPLLASMRR